MNINRIISNPLVKIIAIVLILYFGLFSNNHDNRSLRNRFSADNIKESVDEIAQQKDAIVRNLEQAKKLERSLRLETNEDIEDLTKEPNTNNNEQ